MSGELGIGKHSLENLCTWCLQHCFLPIHSVPREPGLHLLFPWTSQETTANYTDRSLIQEALSYLTSGFVSHLQFFCFFFCLGTEICSQLLSSTPPRKCVNLWFPEGMPLVFILQIPVQSPVSIPYIQSSVKSNHSLHSRIFSLFLFAFLLIALGALFCFAFIWLFGLGACFFCRSETSHCFIKVHTGIGKKVTTLNFVAMYTKAYATSKLNCPGLSCGERGEGGGGGGVMMI